MNQICNSFAEIVFSIPTDELVSEGEVGKVDWHGKNE